MVSDKDVGISHLKHGCVKYDIKTKHVSKYCFEESRDDFRKVPDNCQFQIPVFIKFMFSYYIIILLKCA